MLRIMYDVGGLIAVVRGWARRVFKNDRRLGLGPRWMMLYHAFGVAIIVVAPIHNTLSYVIGPMGNHVHDAVV